MGRQTFESLSIPEVGYILGKGKTGSRYCDKWPLSLLAPFNDHKLLKRHDLQTGPNVTEQKSQQYTPQLRARAAPPCSSEVCCATKMFF